MNPRQWSLDYSFNLLFVIRMYLIFYFQKLISMVGSITDFHIFPSSVEYDTFDLLEIYNKYLEFFSHVFVFLYSTNNYLKDICWLCHGGYNFTTEGRRIPRQSYVST